MVVGIVSPFRSSRLRPHHPQAGVPSQTPSPRPLETGGNRSTPSIPSGGRSSLTPLSTRGARRTGLSGDTWRSWNLTMGTTISGRFRLVGRPWGRGGEQRISWSGWIGGRMGEWLISTWSGPFFQLDLSVPFPASCVSFPPLPCDCGRSLPPSPAKSYYD
jgi:hypothetical protein